MNWNEFLDVPRITSANVSGKVSAMTFAYDRCSFLPLGCQVLPCLQVVGSDGCEDHNQTRDRVEGTVWGAFITHGL